MNSKYLVQYLCNGKWMPIINTFNSVDAAKYCATSKITDLKKLGDKVGEYKILRWNSDIEEWDKEENGFVKFYTQKELDSFPTNERGHKQCPQGDYSEIKNFPPYCEFANGCVFSEKCNFSKGCSFGKECHFGRRCNFDYGCDFGGWCDFGDRCSFGECCFFGAVNAFGRWCTFDRCCNFGWKCNFDEECSFERECVFGDCCSFGRNCECEFGELQNLYIFGFGENNSQNKSAYFFRMTDNSICVRHGSFAGTIDEWEQRMKKIYAHNYWAKKYLLIGKAVREICEQDL